jgi:exopolysaccharide biosynthesis protein
MVVDGRQPGYSEGVDFPELVNLIVSFGAYNATNMDGGGSSAMVIKGLDGKARVLNSPCDNNVPGKERAVANHLGIFFRAWQQKTSDKNDSSGKTPRDDRE